MTVDSEAVYYRVYQRDDGKVVVICVQWFDEFHYDHARYVTEEQFETESAAQAWIDRQYRIWAEHFRAR